MTTFDMVVRGVAASLAAAALTALAACSGGEASPADDDAMEATLCLNVEQLTASRADLASLDDNEKMHSVRVVILRPDGTVEHNCHYSLSDAATSRYIILKVHTGERKTIYFFANEESVAAVEGASAGATSLTGFLDSYPAGAPAGFASEVAGLYFAPDYVAADGSLRPIPMSSAYEVDMPLADNFSGTFYVVRVATKFVVNFTSWRATPTLVDAVGMECHARKNFLMAAVEPTKRNENLLAGYATWVDWLKDVADASSPTDKGYNVSNWLIDYGMPAGEASATVYRSPSSIAVPKAANDVAGTAQFTFYLPESKHIRADAANGEQDYQLTVSVTDLNAGTFYCPLTGLDALFRNTEVIVNITLNDHSIAAEVDARPYSSVELNPQFGLSPKPAAAPTAP